MSLTTNLSGNPYFDDFSDAKKFLRLLFKPGYAVQARELTQIQSSLQSQIGRFGDHIFKNGSVVTGGEYFLQDTTYLKLSPTYSSGNTTVDVAYTNFVDKTIFSVDETKRAQIIKVYDMDQGTSDPITLMVKQLYGSDFVAGDTIKTQEITEDGPFFATITEVGTGQTFSINEGVFYYDGFFIYNEPQTVATSKYAANTATVKIGFELEESVVTSDSDSSLLEPAQDSTNYQAPGADRYKVDLVLSTRSLDSVDLEKFIEIMQVKNGQIITENKYPIYSVLADTFARRTYDESGNYTTKAFTISLEDNSANSAQTDIILSPGKAYVYGYEFETISPTVLTVDKPRTTELIDDKRLPVEHGNYVYTTKHRGYFPLDTLETVDIQCVNAESILTSSSSAKEQANTKIGTARIKTMFFDSSANTYDANTYIYQTFLFDVNINNSVTGNVLSYTSTASGYSLNVATTKTSNIAGAYVGARLRILEGPGTGESSKVITEYYNTGANNYIKLSSGFSAALTPSSKFSIDFEFKDGESLYKNANSVANFAEKTKDLSKTYNDAILFESNLEPLIQRLGADYIALNSIDNLSFSYKRLYTNVEFSGGISSTLTTSDAIADAGSIVAKQQNYYISVITSGSSPYSPGTVIPADKFIVDSSGKTITVTDGGNMTAAILATIDTTGATRKSKVYIAANSTIQQQSSGNAVFSNTAFISYPNQGQCHIDSSYLIKVPGVPQSLHVSDVISIEEIRDFKEFAITTANVGQSDIVTNNYILDTGQRDSYYDHATITLKTGVTRPRGPLLVKYNRFKCDQDVPGFFSVDSYSGISYDDIPVYESKKTNSQYNLRDCLDFRPVRKDSTTGSENQFAFIVGTTTPGGTLGPKIPEYSSDVILDYEYYLPRVDKVILDKTKVFNVVKGNPSLNPIIPNDSSTGMTLFVVYYPPYTASSSDIRTRMIEHRRYTMRDIGSIDKRLQNIEYYTALTLLEHETLTKQDLTILDTQNVPRFKNGIIVDSFKGQSIGDVSNDDFSCAIDPINKELRAKYNVSGHRLNFDSANSSHYAQTGSLISLPFTNTVFIDQNKATKITNVNPFNVINFLGKLKLIPDSDIWVDTVTKAALLVNMEGDRDAWELIAENAMSYEWGAWNTVSSGVIDTDVDTQTSRSTRTSSSVSTGVTTTTTTTTTKKTTTTTTQQNQTRTGIQTSIVPSTMTRSLGNRVVDVSIIPYMQAINILFVGTDFKPNRELYPYFENQPVKQYISNRVNKFTLANNSLNFAINYSNPKIVTIKDNASSVVGTGLVVHTSNNIVYVTNIVASAPFNDPAKTYTITGVSTDLVSNVTYNITSYSHAGGTFASVTDTSHLTLRVDGKYASNLENKTIYVISGTGAGQNSTITSYTSGTGAITVNPAFTVKPSTDSEYGIGDLRTDLSGSVVGIFSVPAGRFLVGEKLLRLMDNIFGDLTSSSTSGDGRFYAQGLTQTTQETILSTTVPTIQRVLVNDERVVLSTDRRTTTSTSTTTSTTTYVDPVAETFLVNPSQYPSGIFLTKLRCCFKTKDESVPITLQLRTTVNGYPSSSVVYPYSTVTLTPDKINISDIPNLEDSTKYSEFVFDSPVYLQPGEHAFVLMSNSNKYETYLAQIGATDLTTGLLVSEQPYGGTYFASQSSTTWTADQTSDLMFRLYRADFDIRNVADVNFLINVPDENTKYNLLQLLTSEIILPQTAIDYYYKPELESAAEIGYSPIIPGKDYELDDSLGMRILNTATGSNTFMLNSILASVSSAVSPIIDSSRIGVILVENIINNLALIEEDFVISAGGTNYINTASVTVTISGGGGSSANAFANVAAGGVIDAIHLNDGGSGYYYSPTVTITGPGTGAIVTYNGETEKYGGNALTRYICRRVTLSDGFDSGDLRVYLTAYKPSGTNIHVYYKILSLSDNEQFENKKWQLMTQLGNANYTSINKDDYRELVFSPGTDGTSDNQISYTNDYGSSFNTFITFAIKIVMSSEKENIVPKIRDFRAIALPEG